MQAFGSANFGLPISVGQQSQANMPQNHKTKNNVEQRKQDEIDDDDKY